MSWNLYKLCTYKQVRWYIKFILCTIISNVKINNLISAWPSKYQTKHQKLPWKSLSKQHFNKILIFEQISEKRSKNSSQRKFFTGLYRLMNGKTHGKQQMDEQTKKWTVVNLKDQPSRSVSLKTITSINKLAQHIATLDIP